MDITKLSKTEQAFLVELLELAKEAQTYDNNYGQLGVKLKFIGKKYDDITNAVTLKLKMQPNKKEEE